MKFPDCPKCKIRFSKQLHRNFVLKVMFPWLRLRHFYCKNCDGSYYRFVDKTSK
jgi:hypothetical protein